MDEAECVSVQGINHKRFNYKQATKKDRFLFVSIINKNSILAQLYIIVRFFLSNKSVIFSQVVANKYKYIGMPSIKLHTRRVVWMFEADYSRVISTCMHLSFSDFQLTKTKVSCTRVAAWAEACKCRTQKVVSLKQGVIMEMYTMHSDDRVYIMSFFSIND